MHFNYFLFSFLSLFRIFFFLSKILGLLTSYLLVNTYPITHRHYHPMSQFPHPQKPWNSPLGTNFPLVENPCIKTLKIKTPYCTLFTLCFLFSKILWTQKMPVMKKGMVIDLLVYKLYILLENSIHPICLYKLSQMHLIIFIVGQKCTTPFIWLFSVLKLKDPPLLFDILFIYTWGKRNQSYARRN